MLNASRFRPATPPAAPPASPPSPAAPASAAACRCSLSFWPGCCARRWALPSSKISCMTLSRALTVVMLSCVSCPAGAGVGALAGGCWPPGRRTGPVSFLVSAGFWPFLVRASWLSARFCSRVLRSPAKASLSSSLRASRARAMPNFWAGTVRPSARRTRASSRLSNSGNSSYSCLNGRGEHHAFGLLGGRRHQFFYRFQLFRERRIEGRRVVVGQQVHEIGAVALVAGPQQAGQHGHLIEAAGEEGAQALVGFCYFCHDAG